MKIRRDRSAAAAARGLGWARCSDCAAKPPWMPGCWRSLEQSGENIRDVAAAAARPARRLPRARGPRRRRAGPRAPRRPHRPRHHPSTQRQRPRRAPPGGAGARRSQRRRRDARASDGHALATALDDIVDFAEQTADALGVYGVEAPMEQSVALAEVLVAASDEVARALAALGDGDADALAGAAGDPPARERGRPRPARGPRVPVRQRDRSDGRHPLEGHLRIARVAVDACQTVAHLIEGISLKRNMRRP